MPEREFELYLSALSRLLRLNPQQKDAIADELRITSKSVLRSWSDPAFRATTRSGRRSMSSATRLGWQWISRRYQRNESGD